MFFFASFLCCIRFLERPEPLNIFLLGLTTGLALLSKFTCNLLPPLLVLLTVLFLATDEYRTSGNGWQKYAVGLAAAFAVAVFVLNAGYGFHGAFAPLSDYEWKSGLFKTLKGTLLGKMPVPLPHLYVAAVDTQLFNRNVFVYYMNGHLSREGWAGYYWVALLLKTPVPLLAAGAAALAMAFRRGAPYRERALWAGPAMFMLAFTFYVRIDMGVRYLYPMMPFLFVLGGGALHRLAGVNKAAAAATACLCLWYCLSIASTPGNGLAYFNEFAGGPAGGHQYLVESNLDWGQNLVRLKKFVEQTKPEPLLVYNYGLTPPSAYGIENAGWVPCEPTPAVVAISVNYIKGIDPFQHRSKECFSWLADRKPDEILGHGLWIYDTRKDIQIK